MSNWKISWTDISWNPIFKHSALFHFACLIKHNSYLMLMQDFWFKENMWRLHRILFETTEGVKCQLLSDIPTERVISSRNSVVPRLTIFVVKNGWHTEQLSLLTLHDIISYNWNAWVDKLQSNMTVNYVWNQLYKLSANWGFCIKSCFLFFLSS